MKTILVLTDFSENALKAAETAAMLSGTLKANILLLNSNYAVPAIPYYPGVVLVNESISWEDECEGKLNQLADHLRKMVLKLNVDRRKPVIHTLLVEGDLWGNVKKIIKKENIEMIIMGSRSGSNLDHILFGSDTSAIVDHATCPVLIVSSNSHLTRLNRVVFATNFNKEDQYAITYLMKLGKLFQYQLEVVHVSLYHDHSIPEDPLVIDFIKQLSEINYPNVIYRDIRGKDLAQRLRHICEEREADLLAFTHHQHSYLATILKEGTVKKSISHQKMPLLIFPLQPQHGQEAQKTLTGYIL